MGLSPRRQSDVGFFSVGSCVGSRVFKQHERRRVGARRRLTSALQVSARQDRGAVYDGRCDDVRQLESRHDDHSEQRIPVLCDRLDDYNSSREQQRRRGAEDRLDRPRWHPDRHPGLRGGVVGVAHRTRLTADVRNDRCCSRPGLQDDGGAFLPAGVRFSDVHGQGATADRPGSGRLSPRRRLSGVDHWRCHRWGRPRRRGRVELRRPVRNRHRQDRHGCTDRRRQ